MRLKLEPTNLQKSKKKLVLVTILGLVFVAVLYSSFGSSDKRADSSPSPAQPAAVAASPAAPAVDSATSVKQGPNQTASAINSTKGVEPTAKILLPEIDLDRIVARNPFVDSLKPDTTLQSTAGQSGTKSSTDSSNVDQALQTPSDEQPKVDGVVTGGRRPAALINNKLYFENDIVDQRWVIEQILPKEVIFKPSGSNS